MEKGINFFLDRYKKLGENVSRIRLKPSLRVKKRFLLLKIISSAPLTESSLSKGLSSHLLTYLGIKEFGECGFWFLKDKFDYDTQQAIVKISLSSQKNVLGALGFLEEIEGKKVRCDVIKISGTLKGLE